MSSDFSSPYKKVGISAHSRTKRKVNKREVMGSQGIKTGHIWDNVNYGLGTCRKCKKPNFIVGDQVCKGKKL